MHGETRNNDWLQRGCLKALRLWKILIFKLSLKAHVSGTCGGRQIAAESFDHGAGKTGLKLQSREMLWDSQNAEKGKAKSRHYER